MADRISALAWIAAACVGGVGVGLGVSVGVYAQEQPVVDAECVADAELEQKLAQCHAEFEARGEELQELRKHESNARESASRLLRGDCRCGIVYDVSRGNAEATVTEVRGTRPIGCVSSDAPQIWVTPRDEWTFEFACLPSDGLPVHTGP